MCQAFEGEQRFLNAIGGSVASRAFFAAMAGEPFDQNECRSILFGDDYRHGYACFAERIIPWGVERDFHMIDNPAYSHFWKMRDTFKATGDFRKAIEEIPVEQRPERYKNLDWVPTALTLS